MRVSTAAAKRRDNSIEVPGKPWEVVGADLFSSKTRIYVVFT